MKRIEIIANKSVQDDIVEGLENALPDICYTLFPVVHGRSGGAKYRMGTATWPEENFCIVSYLDDASAAAAERIVNAVKAQYPGEGIKLFAVNAA